MTTSRPVLFVLIPFIPPLLLLTFSRRMASPRPLYPTSRVQPVSVLCSSQSFGLGLRHCILSGGLG